MSAAIAEWAAALSFLFMFVFIVGSTRRRGIDQVWARAAQALGATIAKPGPFGFGLRHLTCRFEDVDVAVYPHVTSASVEGLRAEARVAHADDFELSVLPRSFVSLAVDDEDIIETDDADFDALWVVHTNDPARARAWLDRGLRRTIEELYDSRVYIRQGQLTIYRLSHQPDEAMVLNLVSATSRLARRGSDLRRFWAELAERRGSQLELGPRDRHRIELGRVGIESVANERGGTAVVVERAHGKGERFRFDAGDTASAPVSASLRARIKALGAIRVEAEPTAVRIELDDAEHDEERLELAIELAEELATSLHRGYR